MTGKTVNDSLMEPSWCLRDVVTDLKGERKRIPTDIPVVLLPVFPALLKSDGDDLIPLAKAKVVPEWVPRHNDGLMAFMGRFGRSKIDLDVNDSEFARKRKRLPRPALGRVESTDKRDWRRLRARQRWPQVFERIQSGGRLYNCGG